MYPKHWTDNNSCAVQHDKCPMLLLHIVSPIILHWRSHQIRVPTSHPETTHSTFPLDWMMVAIQTSLSKHSTGDCVLE